MRLIDAEQLEKLFREVIGRLAHEPSIINKDMEHFIRASAMAIQMINDAPTVNDPLPYYKECDNCKEATNYKPIKGKWIDKHETILGSHQFACSVCKVTFGFNGAVGRYCPNCGADMRGEKNA